MPGPGTAGSTLTDIVAGTSGCVDQIRLNFSPSLVPSTIGYDINTTGITSATAASVRLVVKLGGPAVVTAGRAIQPASTVSWTESAGVNARSLGHIRQIDVQPGTNGELDVFIVLEARSRFTAVASGDPASLVVSVGAAD